MLIPRTRSRRGVTLVEAMVMMTAVATMLGTCVLMLGLAMRLQAEGLASFGRSETFDRLSARFRDDVHAARSATMDGRKLRLEPDAGKVVEYRVDEEGRLIRVVVAAGKDAAREPYFDPDETRTRLDLRDIDGRRFAVLAVDFQGRPDRIDPIRTVEVQASVGRSLPPVLSEGGRP